MQVMEVMEVVDRKETVLYSLVELSAYYSLNRLNALLMNGYFTVNTDAILPKQNICSLYKRLSGKLVDSVVSSVKSRDGVSSGQWMQMLVLCRGFEHEMQTCGEFVSNYSDTENEYKYWKCIQWSFIGLNLVITCMAMTSKADKHFFNAKTCESFKPKFVDIFYKLKSLKVLSFLAIEPRLPIELLSLIISETFLWTEPTELDVNVMAMHSRLISYFSNLVKDNKTFNTYMREDFLFNLKECHHFIATHLHSFCDYLVKRIDKTQIHVIVDHLDTNLMNEFKHKFPEDHHLIELFVKCAENRSLLTNEDFLMPFVKKSLNYPQNHCSDHCSTGD